MNCFSENLPRVCVLVLLLNCCVFTKQREKQDHCAFTIAAGAAAGEAAVGVDPPLYGDAFALPITGLADACLASSRGCCCGGKMDEVDGVVGDVFVDDAEEDEWCCIAFKAAAAARAASSLVFVIVLDVDSFVDD